MAPVVTAWRRWLHARRDERLGRPGEAIEIQQRLARLAAELSCLDRAPVGSGFAGGHHLRAALTAYEQTLDEACVVAGVPVLQETGPVHRLLAEAALREVGWAW